MQDTTNTCKKELVLEWKIVNHYIFLDGNFSTMKEVLLKEMKRFTLIPRTFIKLSVRQSVKDGNVVSFSHVFESHLPRNNYRNTEGELKVFTHYLCDNFDYYFKYLEEFRERTEKE